MYRHRSREGMVCLDDHRDQERVCKALNLLIRQDVLTDWHIGRRVRGVERRDHWPSWWTFCTSHITDIDNLLAPCMRAVISMHVYTRILLRIDEYFLMLHGFDIGSKNDSFNRSFIAYFVFAYLNSSIMLFWTKDKKKIEHFIIIMNKGKLLMKYPLLGYYYNNNLIFAYKLHFHAFIFKFNNKITKIIKMRNIFEE